jgi:hypothetical protein
MSPSCSPSPLETVLLFACSSFLLGIWVLLLMQSVPLNAVLHFDLHAAILGWLLTTA